MRYENSRRKIIMQEHHHVRMMFQNRMGTYNHGFCHRTSLYTDRTWCNMGHRGHIDQDSTLPTIQEHCKSHKLGRTIHQGDCTSVQHTSVDCLRSRSIVHFQILGGSTGSLGDKIVVRYSLSSANRWPIRKNYSNLGGHVASMHVEIQRKLGQVHTIDWICLQQ